MNFLPVCLVFLSEVLMVTAALVTYSPGPSYAIGIPSTTTAGDGGTGNIYLRISAPTTYQWAALGIGKGMVGAHIFVIYTDGKGNVTVSGRMATEHKEPQVDSDLNVELLAGSGIMDGTMVANIRCNTCAQYLSSTTDSSSPWIAAWKLGNAIDSQDPGADLVMHDQKRQVNLDLSQSSVADDNNPFLLMDADEKNATSVAGAATEKDDDDDDDDDDEDDDAVYDRAHGIMMALAIIVLFPLGALFMLQFGASVAHPARIHGFIQVIALSVFIAAFGLGVHLANITDQLFNNVHTRFGTAILVLLLLQPLGGLVHHWRFRKGQVSEKRKLALGHRWLGRITLGLAVINGGLGLKLANGPKGAKIAYGVVAGLMALVWAILALIKCVQGRHRTKNGGLTEENSKKPEITENAATTPQ